VSTGLYSGVSGLALGTGLYKGAQGLWGGSSGLIDQFGATLSLNFLAGAPLDSRITFSRTTNATLVDSTGRVTYAPNNQVLRSEEFDNAAWTKTRSSITANATTSPDGTTNADRFVIDTTAATNHAVGQSASVTSGTTYALTVFAKADQFSQINLRFSAQFPAGNVYYDLNSGTVSSAGSVVSASMTSFGNGWWRCVLVMTANATGASAPQIFLAQGNSITIATADGTSGLFIWGAQLEAVTYQTLPSTYVQTVASAYYGPRFDYDPVTLAARGLLIEEQRVNSIRNSIGVGAVAGTPGTAPTNWSVSTTGSGITREIVGTGMENGVSYIDIKFSGTPTIALALSIGFDGTNNIAATSGQTWTESAYVKLQAGSFVGTQTTLSILGTDGTIGTESFGSANITSTSSNLAASRLSFTATLANVLTTFVQPRLRIGTTIGVPFDITLRIGLPQLELGAFATSVIPTATAQVTRAADNASMTGTNFSSWYNASEGTVVANFGPFFRTTGNPGVVQIDDGAATNTIRTYAGSVVSPVFAVSVGGVTQAFLNAGTINTNANTSIAGAYALDNFAKSINGLAPETDTSGTVPVVNRMLIGSGTAGVNYLNGYMRSITYYPQRLADAQLQALSV
jgi:hypothetical protein